MWHRGCIVNVIDIHALRLLKGVTVYCTPKRVYADEIPGVEASSRTGRINWVAPRPTLRPEAQAYAPGHQAGTDRTVL
ncbi:MAG TPA: hypothetical protein VHK27_01975 [Gammaproteobacteria bacterium]|nr:hypothetical protein [Gammaproteobacteria bacterium]